MRKLGVVLVAMALVVPLQAALAAHDFGQTGVNNNLVNNVVQLTYPDAGNTPPGLFASHDAAQCWGAYPWSSDGSQIVFTTQIPGECSDRSCNEIAIMNADGSGFDRLTENSDCDTHASFVPPGTAVVVYQSEPDGWARIFSVNVATKVVTNLTEAHAHVATCPGEDNDYTENKPVVSPDGQHIAYRSCDTSLWVMDIDGTDPVEIAPPGLDIHHHSWDPTSSWLVFAVGCDLTGASRILMAAADGSSHDDLVELADHSATDQCAGWPTWSPDGQWIAYHLGEGDSEEEDEGKAIWLVNPVTLARRLLVEGPAGQDVCGPTSWSPNSSFLAFKMDPDGNDSLRALYLVEVANGAVWPLTNGFWDYRHWFAPSGAAILFRDAAGSGGYCQASRDGCENGSDLLVLNLRNAASFLGDEGIGLPIPAATPAGLIALALLIAVAGAVVVVRRST